MTVNNPSTSSRASSGVGQRPHGALRVQLQLGAIGQCAVIGFGGTDYRDTRQTFAASPIHDCRTTVFVRDPEVLHRL